MLSAVPFIAGLLPARELNVRPRARARKPENRREEDENGIRGTVGGEEAGKAGSRFRKRVGTRACRRSEKRKRNSDIARGEKLREGWTKRVRRMRINGQMTTEA